MASKAIIEKNDPSPKPGGWQPRREMAPSVMRSDEQRVPQIIGMAGLIGVTLGSVALLISIAGGSSRVNPTFGAVLLLGGLACLLFHAVNDNDVQIRRSYGVLGYLLLALGIVISLLPIKGGVGAQFLPYGFTSFTLALLFLMAFARNESDPLWRRTVVRVLGVVGLALAATAFIGGNASVAFLLPAGLVLAVLGLGYLWSFILLRGPTDDLGYRVSQGLGVVGALFVLIALARSTLPSLFYSWGWLTNRPDAYLIPSGLLLMTIGAIYALLGYGLCSDRPLAVLTRRELAAFFFSPVAYIVLVVLTLVAWVNYLIFIITLVPSDPMAQGGEIPEPVIAYYIISWLAVLVTVFVVPALTMRLLSEEHRSGTIEVLFTAPVSEIAVVLSKFLAAFIFFMMAWVPWGLLLISLLIEGGRGFEYRPLFSFFIALACTGAGFIAMGVFFSSLTRHQIAAFLITFVGMVFYLAIYFVKELAFRENSDSLWAVLMNHVSYVGLWITSMRGMLTPELLVFHVSAAIFWLFLTVKVLEARKWL